MLLILGLAAVAIWPAGPMRRILGRDGDIDSANVNVWALVEQDVTPAPATRPMLWVSWLRVLGPDEAVSSHGAVADIVR